MCRYFSGPGGLLIPEGPGFNLDGICRYVGKRGASRPTGRERDRGTRAARIARDSSGMMRQERGCALVYTVFVLPAVSLAESSPDARGSLTLRERNRDVGRLPQ